MQEEGDFLHESVPYFPYFPRFPQKRAICELKDIEISNKSISMSVAIHQRTLYRWLSMPLTLSHCMPNEEYKMKAYDKQKLLYTICCPILAKPSALNGCNLAFEIRAF